MVNIGLAGYGSAGRGFHAPLVQAAGMSVVAVSTSRPERVDQVRTDLPGARVVADLAELLQVGGLDLVVLATPSGDHLAHARQVIDAGIPLVVDKPLAVTAGEALEVVDAAARAGVPLTVFQNRRFDSEHATLREVIRAGRLGEVFRAELRWERWRPVPRDRWRETAAADEGGGLLLDLHTHLIDEVVDLFGPVQSVYAEIAAHTTRAEDDAFLACRHTSGVVSHLGATSLAGAPGPRIRVLGNRGAFVLNEFADDADDVYPDLANPDEHHCGWVYAGAQRDAAPRAATTQADFYRAVAGALALPDPQPAMPVDPRDAVHVLAVIDAARASAGHQMVECVRTPGESAG